MTKRRPFSANDVADWFINNHDRDAPELITPLMVQRLVFFAQAWHLANKGRPLFSEDFLAWATGPIALSIFERFEHYRQGSIFPIDNAREMIGEKLELLESVRENYGRYSARGLDELAREAGGPWEAARRGIAPEALSDNIVGKDAIKKFYGEKIGKSWK